MNITLHVVIDEKDGMGNADDLLFPAPSVIIRYLKELAEGKIVVVGSKVPVEVYNELRNECDEVVIFTQNRRFIGPNGGDVIHRICDVTRFSITRDVLIIGDAETCEAFVPLATKMHHTVIDHLFPCTMFFPDYDEHAWKEMECMFLPGNEVTGWKKMLFRNYVRKTSTA